MFIYACKHAGILVLDEFYKTNANNSLTTKSSLCLHYKWCSCVTVFSTMTGSQSSSNTFIFHQTSMAPVGHDGEMGRPERERGRMSSDVEEALSTEDQQSNNI